MVTGEVLVQFKSTATAAEIRDFMDEAGATRLRRFPKIRAEHHRITHTSVEDAVTRFRGHRAVEIIEPNWIVQADAIPNDPQFHLLWGLQNTGQTGGFPGSDIRAVPAWDVETGSPSVIVAVIDTGVDIYHPDLAANIWINLGEIPGNKVDDDGNGWVDDVNGYDFFNLDADPTDDVGHGTHVAGTIAAVGNNSVGITGVAWNARLMALKFLGANGTGPISAAVEAIEYAIQMGAHVLNNSWGGTRFSSILQIAIQSANQQGIPFVAAAGNAGVSLESFTHYPASYDLPNVIAVASTTSQDALSPFSNFGPTKVDLAAPGSSIWSTRPGAEYGYESGTSMATPHVSGALALLRSEFPNMPGEQLRATLLSSVDAVPALEGFVLAGGRLNVARMLSGPDSIPPAPVASLVVHRVDSDRVVLRWTATGDDGELGRASRYDLRFDFGPIDESSFEFAQPAGMVPVPGPAGSTEEATVEGLRHETTYTFALKVIDEYGNASPLSNLASARTIGPPEISVTPASVEVSLQTGQKEERQVTVTNVAAEGTLEFSAASASPSPTATAQPFLVLDKGATDPRVGDPVADGRGGPDGFGYQWIDNDEIGGPSFQWTDIAATGSRISLEGDDAMSPFVPIGFLFPFYDNLYAYVRVSTNGFLSFSSGAADFTNQTLPNPSAPENMVAPFWDDLVFAGNSAAHAWGDGHRFIIQWSNVFHFTGGGPYTFQAVLHADGTIVYQYLTVGSPATSATVGIQNASRNDGLTVVFNNTYVHGGLAVRLHAAPGWLSVVPQSGRLAPGQSMPLTVRFDASRLPGGTYDAVVRLTSNDPVTPVADLTARLAVEGATDIAFASPSLGFFQIFVGASEVQPVTVSNEGILPLVVTSLQASPSVFEVEDVPFTLGPAETRDVEVRFRPTAPGTVQGVLTVTSNDPDEGIATVALTGTALLPPDVTVTPDSLHASLLTGESATRELSIGNTGASNLRWTVVPQNGNARSTVTVTLEPPLAQGVAPDGASSSGDPALTRTGSIAADLVNLDGVRVLFDGAHESSGTSGWSRLIGELTERGATVTRSTSPITPELLDGFDILWITDSQSTWLPSEVNATRDWLLTGGALLLEGDNAPSIPIFNTLLRAANARFRYQEVRGASGVTTRVHPHPVTRDVLRVNLDANLATLAGIVAPAVLLVEDLAGQASGAAIPVGAGRILAFTDEVFSDFHSSFADNQLLANQAFDWLSGMTWLRAAPSSGVTPPGGVSPVTVTMDATGIAGGEYAASLVVASDDPDEAERTVPVSLHVTGAPDLLVSPASLEFDTLYVAQNVTRELRIMNRGSDGLEVTEATIPLPGFTVSPSALSLAPLQSAVMSVTFTPDAPGERSTTLTIASNDPGSPAVVPIAAVVLVPPVIEVEPIAFVAAVPPGAQVVKTIRIRNTGGSDLRWTGPGSSGVPNLEVPWITLQPSSGAVPADQAVDVSVRIDAAELQSGHHSATVTLRSNDPANPTRVVEVLAHVGSVDAAEVDVDPNTLNVESRGRWAVARVELPSSYDPALVVASTVRWNGTVPLAEGTDVGIADFNGNGVPDLELRFSREAVEAVLQEGDSVPITIIGEIRDIIWFTGHDVIRVLRPRLVVPKGGELIPAGSSLRVEWVEPQGWGVDHADLTVSFDGGDTWRMLAEGIRGTTYAWTVPHTPTTRALIRVHLYDGQGMMGYDATDAAFTIQPTISAVETEAGASPAVHALHPNAPNPFNPMTWIRFDLARAGRITLQVVAADGRMVREWNEDLSAGRHRVRWDGRAASGSQVGSGVYFARLTVSGEAPFEASRRMIVLK
jgi:subtilisin family serine protease